VTVIEGTDGGVVLDVVPGRDRPERIDETVVELGERLGYVRVPARALATTGAPGLLATLPPQVPVAIGGAPATGPDTAEEPGGAEHAGDLDHQVTRAVALRAAVDAFLRHPHAAPAS
jgi:hypothetical protein